VGGDFSAVACNIENIQLGPIVFQGVTGFVVVSKGSYDDGSDGVIGNDFLGLFTLGLDYEHSRVYLVPRPATLQQMHPQ